MTDLPALDAEEQRVLGSLLEKQRTVPDSYPLTLNSLRTACNQSSSREPVVDYDEHTVEQVGRRLKDRGLLRIVWSDTGRRTLKYHQVLDEVLDLAEDERALVTVLLLRGPQAPGELKTRTERLHGFADRGAVEQTLSRMAERGLVRELPRRGGDRDSRWAHLLGEEAAVEEAPAPIVDVLAAGGGARDERVRSSYDAVATAYADHLLDELAGLPFETWLLDRVAAHAADDRAGGPVVDAGCGPGHVTAYLADAGVDAHGIDLSPAMVAEARRRFPDGSYEVGDLRRLMRPTTAEGWAAVLGWYSLGHLASAELPDAVAALARPLAPGGWLVLAGHAGVGVRHLDAWFEHEVDLDFVAREPEEIVAAVTAAGLVDVEWFLRGPLADRGETTERLYLLARRG
ncbi:MULTISPECIES: DUF480 domain-containing protein [unclassified Nocardioides]|uniref:DUF480 domain-containing protein n=1 Tax=unclassified Nocardioides TaxID=2615069 RepID=UPI0000570E27|nr:MULTISPECIES: DUF480 domain-containing protein [unclassified Nocardioides]ABL82284.1 protein of unknown function DUF480 [Nocardioides sp. JS614]